MVKKSSAGPLTAYLNLFGGVCTGNDTGYHAQVDRAEFPQYYQHRHGGQKRDKAKAKAARAARKKNRQR